LGFACLGGEVVVWKGVGLGLELCFGTGRWRAMAWYRDSLGNQVRIGMSCIDPRGSATQVAEIEVAEVGGRFVLSPRGPSWLDLASVGDRTKLNIDSCVVGCFSSVARAITAAAASSWPRPPRRGLFERRSSLVHSFRLAQRAVGEWPRDCSEESFRRGIG